MVDGQVTDVRRVGNFSEQVWGELRERCHAGGNVVSIAASPMSQTSMQPTLSWQLADKLRLHAIAPPPRRTPAVTVFPT